MRLALPVLLLLFAASAADAQRRPDSVSLRFKWPTGTTAQVEQEWIRVTSSPERRDSITIRSRYRLRVLDHADGQLVSADSFVLSGTSGLPTLKGQASDVQRLATHVGSFQPSYIVSREGEFRRVENVARMKQLLDSLIAPLLQEMKLKDAPAELQAIMRNATSEQSMAGSAAQEWDAVVGTWAGADWVIGQAYESMVQEPVPIMADLKIPMRYEFGAAERVPCTAAAGGTSCVRLEMYSEPDTAALRGVMADMMKRLGAAEKDLLTSLQNVRTTNQVTLITEPQTLRPYELTRVRRVDVRVAPGGKEKPGTTTRVDIRTARYRYAP